MRTHYKKFVLFLSMFVLLFVGGFSLSGCSGGNEIPPEVCEYGQMVVQVAQTLCDNFPQIPPEICTWVDIAQINLDALCNSEPGSLAYKQSLTSLQYVNANLLLFIENYKMKRDTLQ